MTIRLPLALLLFASATLAADDANGKRLARLEARAAAAADAFRAELPPQFLQDAHGYAVLPTVTRAGAGLGAAWGRGVVYERGQAIGTVRYWQVTSGIQAGAAAVSVIVLFRDAAALEEFRRGGVHFAGQAGFVLAKLGTLRTPAYDSGVAMFARERFGLMGEATIAAMGLSFSPLP